MAPIATVLQCAQVGITDAQIKTLPTVFPTIIPAPGAGKILLPIASIVRCNCAAGVYTNINASAIFCLQWGTTASGLNCSQTIFQSTSTRLSKLIATASANVAMLNVVGASPPAAGNFSAAFAPSVTATFDNEPVCLAINNNGSGNLTGGNAANGMTVTVWYLEAMNY